MKNKKKGFTLIELLVVVAIISLLSSIVYAAVNNARIKTRNAVTVSNVQAIQTALELYYADNGVYPLIPSAVNYPTMSLASTTFNIAAWDELRVALSPYTTSFPPAVVGSWPVISYYTGGTEPITCLIFPSSHYELRGTGGYLLMGGMVTMDFLAASSDGGVFNGWYERMGGNTVLEPDTTCY